MLVVGLDLTVLNLALPTMAVSLHASTGDLQWIVDSYSLVLAALILPAGLLGDRYGRKRMLLIALVLFGASSLACAYASSVGELIAARAVLGIGAAAIFPLALSVLPVLFAPEERQRAVAAIAGSTMLSFPIGPIVGGYLLEPLLVGLGLPDQRPGRGHRGGRGRRCCCPSPGRRGGPASTWRGLPCPPSAWSR